MRKTLALLLVLAIVSSYGVVLPIEALEYNEMYPIDTPYEYPIVPGTPEWAALENNIAKINACAVPDELVYQMTTDALLETYLTHPLAYNAYAYDDYSLGFEILRAYYHIGLDELLGREDLADAIIKKYSNMDVISADSSVALNKIVSRSNEVQEQLVQAEYDNIIGMQLIEVLAAQVELDENNASHMALAELMYEKFLEKNENSEFYGTTSGSYYKSLPNENARATRTYVYTPNMSSVEAHLNTAADEWSAAELNAVLTRHGSVYQNALKQREPTAMYNCHSYAWYSQSTTNKYWLFEAGPYMEDGSYTQISAPRADARIYYWFPDVPTNDPEHHQDAYYDGGVHSGIVKTVSSNKAYVTSKWGAGALYNHYYDDCPYYYFDNTYNGSNPNFNYNGSITYWYR